MRSMAAARDACPFAGRTGPSLPAVKSRRGHDLVEHRVALGVGLIVVGVAHHDLPGPHHPPARALAAVIRQSTKKWGRVRVAANRLESHRIAVHLDIAPFK
jgi:hypothetical protein